MGLDSGHNTNSSRSLGKLQVQFGYGESVPVDVANLVVIPDETHMGTTTIGGQTKPYDFAAKYGGGRMSAASIA